MALPLKPQPQPSFSISQSRHCPSYSLSRPFPACPSCINTSNLNPLTSKRSISNKPPFTSNGSQPQSQSDASSHTTSTSRARARLARYTSRLPPWLRRRYTDPLLRAPLVHVSSFLVLHEITAIVPLFGLAALFHTVGWVPEGWGLSSSKKSHEEEGLEEKGGEGREREFKGEWIESRAKTALDIGEQRFGRWLRKKGWIVDSSNDSEAGVRGMRVVLEFATAYAVTKLLLPVRVGASVWATPWFATTVMAPTMTGLRRLFRGT